MMDRFRFFVRFRPGQIDLRITEGPHPSPLTLSWEDQGYEHVPYEAFRTAWDGQARLIFHRLGLRPALVVPDMEHTP